MFAFFRLGFSLSLSLPQSLLLRLDVAHRLKTAKLPKPHVKQSITVQGGGSPGYSYEVRYE